MPSRISIEVLTTADLKAITKAAESLKAFGDVVVKTERSAVSAGSSTIRSNEKVAMSYGKMADSATASSAKTAAATKESVSMQRLLQAQLAETTLRTRHLAEAETKHVNALTRSGNALDSAGKKLQGFGRLMAPVSGGLLLIGGYSVKASIDFQKSMTLLQTQAGASAKHVDQLRVGIEKMAPAVGKTPEELAKGIYHVVSAMNAVIPKSKQVSEELAIQKAAAIGASVGHSNLDETTYALVSALNTLRRSGGDATKTMAELHAIVGAGDLTFQEFVASLGSGVLPAAQLFGLSLKSLGAGLDTITQEGTKAQQASTRLRMAVTLLAAPSKNSAKMLEAIGAASGEVTARTQATKTMLEEAGLSTTILAKDMRKPDGLMVALEDLKKHMADAGLTAEEQSALISRAFGGGRMGTSIMTLYQRLPELQKNYNNQMRITGNYSENWAKTQTTTAFKAEQTKASLSETAISLGNDLKPAAEVILTDVEHIAKWFAGLPPDVKRTAEEVAALAVVIAPVALAAGTLARLGGVTFKAAGGIKNLMSGGSLGGGGIAGARGTTLPGSPTNPVVVAVEEGSVTGLGGKAAPGTTVAGEKAAGGVTSTGKMLFGRVLAGGGIALGGIAASEIAGTAIGGKAGQTVSNVGDATAIGAAIGTVVEPGIGTAIGAGLGGIVGAIKALQPATPAEKRAAKLGPQLGAKFHQQAANLEKLKNPNLTHAGYETVEGEIGKLLGQSEKAYVLGGTKNPGLGSIIDTSRRELAKLSPMGRAAFIQMIDSMVKTLEHEGRLAPNSLKKLVASLKPELAGLPKLGGQTGKEFTNQFLANLNKQSMLAGLSSVAEGINKDWAHEFGILPVTTHMTLAEAQTTANHDLGVLQNIMKHGTAQQIQEAKAQYAELAPALQKYMHAAGDAVGSELQALAHHNGPASAKAVSAIVTAYNTLPKSLKEQLEKAGGAVGEGLGKINKEVNVELKALGVANKVAANVTVGLKGFAVGGYIGSRGERGADTVPVLVGRGEAILNHQQQQVVDQSLAATGVGGLDRLFAGTANTKHAFASGGFAGGSVPRMIAEANQITSKHYPYLWGGGHSNFTGPYDCSGAVSAVLHSGGLLSAPRVAGGFENYGLPGPGEVTLFVNDNTHVYMGIGGRTFGTSLANPGGGAGWFAGGPRPGFTERHVPPGLLTGGVGTVKAPKWTGPGGLVGQIGKAALAKATKGANQMVTRALASATGGQVGGGNKGEGAGLVVTASEFGGHNDPSAFDHSTASGKIANDTLMGFAELSNPPGSLGFNALGGLPMGTRIRVGYGGHTVTIPKVDVGAGGPGLNGHVRAIDLTYAAARALGAPGLENVTWARAAAGKPAKQKPGSKLKKVGKALTPKQLQDLAVTGGQVNSMWDDAQSKTTRLTGLQSLYQAEEGDERYLNPDGSLNASGLAKKRADDESLMALQREIQGDYQNLLGPVTALLKEEMGTESKTANTIKADNKRIEKDKLQLASLRKVLLDLRKPIPNVVGSLEHQIETTKHHWAPLLHAAQAARSAYRGKDKPTKERLAAAVAAVKGQEAAALEPLSVSLTNAKAARAAHKQKVSVKSFGIDQQIADISKRDLQLSDQVKQLKEVKAGEAPQVTALTNIAAALGTPKYNSKGQFIGIETTDQGAAFNAGVNLVGLGNDLQGIGRTAAGVQAQEQNPALTQALETMNAQLAQSYALSQAQFSVLSGFKNIPHYAQGGPVLKDGLIYAHQGEHVLTRDQVRESGGQPTQLHNHVSVHGSIAPLIEIIDGRIRHPDNIQHVARRTGRRTGILAGAPGGWRG